MEHHHLLGAIGGYDQALHQLSNQLEPSPGSEKLVFTLKVGTRAAVPGTVFPRFSQAGVLKIV